MKQSIHSAKYLRQRKFMMVLPLLVLPFVVLTFAALGGGKGHSYADKMIQPSDVLNAALPDALFTSRRPEDKMSFYDEAEKDSIKKRELSRHDFKWNEEADLPLKPSAKGVAKDPDSTISTEKTTELENRTQEIIQRLERIQASDRQTDVVIPTSVNHRSKHIILNTSEREDIAASKDQIAAMNMKLREHDPELDQLNQMLDKILLIQNPVKTDSSESGKDSTVTIYSVQPSSDSDTISMDTDSAQMGTQIFSEEDAVIAVSYEGENSTNNLEATVAETTSLTNGSSLEVRLNNAAHIGNTVMPVGQRIYGMATIRGDRILIHVSSVFVDENILPVSLDAYDLDGQPGIHVPGLIQETPVRQSALQSINSISAPSLEASLAMQAANNGWMAAKNVLNKKSHELIVHVNSGYHVILVNQNLHR